jgi:hypothetical protein
MAVTVNTIATGIPNSVFDVIATADADATTGAITHGFNTLGLIFSLVGLIAASQISLWFVSAFTATTVTLNKGVGVGSGNAAAQVRLFVLPFNFADLVPHH